MLLEEQELLLLLWVQGLEVVLLLEKVQGLLGLLEEVLLFKEVVRGDYLLATRQRELDKLLLELLQEELLLLELVGLLLLRLDARHL